MSLTRWRDTGGEFSFDGHRIFIKTHGAGRQAVLLLHGYPTASWDFEGLWPGLCRRFAHVVTLDLLGFGFSDKPRPHRYSIAEQATLVEHLLAARGVEAVHLLAHGYGACVAEELLAREADRRGAAGGGAQQVSSVVFFNAALFADLYRPRWAQRLLTSPIGPLFARLAGPRRFNHAFLPLFGPHTRPGMIELDDYWTLLSLRDGARVMRSLLSFIDELRRQRLRWTGALTSAGVPMCFVYGTADPTVPPAVASRYREIVPGAALVELPDIGHYPHVEAPDRCLRAVLNFHDSITPAP